MMRKILGRKACSILAVLAAISQVSTGWSAAGKEWEQVSNDDGILVHKKEVPGSDVIAFRGEAIIDAPIAKVAQIMMDTPRKMEWVARIADAKNIRELGFLERIEYNATYSGFFLVRDRDFVFHAKGEVDCRNKRLVFRLKSVVDKDAPETDRVRGHINSGIYEFEAIEGGKKTHMVVEIHADPKGSVPKWLVNLVQKSWPRNTIEGIRKQAAKTDVTENADVVAAMSCKYEAPAVQPSAKPPGDSSPTKTPQ